MALWARFYNYGMKIEPLPKNRISLDTIHLLVGNPLIRYKNTTKTCLKLKQKIEKKENQQLAKYNIEGKEAYRPYPHTVYIRETGWQNPDPNSNRRETRKRR